MSTLPVFWLEPLAKALLPDPDRVGPPNESRRAPVAWGDTAAPPKLLLLVVAARAGAEVAAGPPKPSPAPNVEFPPGGACRRVDGRPRMLFPSFWHALPARAPRRPSNVAARPTLLGLPPPSSPKRLLGVEVFLPRAMPLDTPHTAGLPPLPPYPPFTPPPASMCCGSLDERMSRLPPLPPTR